MKRFLALFAILLMVCGWASPADTLISQTITLTTTPIRVTTFSTTASSVFIQMQPGSTGTGFVLFANPSATCSTSNKNQVVATLAPGTTTSPGSSFSYPSNNVNGGNSTDVSWFCVAGTSPDTAIVSYSKR